MRPGHVLHVAPEGSDGNPGTEAQPLLSPSSALAAARRLQVSGTGPVSVVFHSGTYYLRETLGFLPRDSGKPGASVTWSAAPGAEVTLSGGRRLSCSWRPYRDGIMICDLSPEEADPAFTQLFVDGKRQTLARWPNRDDSAPRDFSGYTRPLGSVGADVVDPEAGPDDDMAFSCGAPRGLVYDPATFSPRRWRKPEEAIIHAFQAWHWGNLQWRLRGVDRERHILWFAEGGWQIGAKYIEDPCAITADSAFFVENLLEELDSPGEWYLDREGRVLYFMPPEGLDLERATVEVPRLRQLVHVAGSQADPVHDLVFRGLRFAHSASTFLEPYTVPSRSDWSIHRGGALFLDGTRDCSVEACHFDAVGGNAVFVSRHNRGTSVERCLFTEAGDSAVCFVGSFEDTVGTQRSFPYECRATDNLIQDCGAFGKQVAGVYISRAKRITVGHNEIRRMPRAGICIGDGTWGGHVIEFNHVHDTCRETGDHGPFNAWGRDLYWCLSQSHEAYTPARSHDAGQVRIDAMEAVIVRNNLFEESSGWGLDLDDGASNYEIYNNLCLGVSVKLREGAYRTIYNNIWVNGANSPCFHVGNEDNHDRYFRNITVMRTGSMRPENDLNFAMGKGNGEIYTLIAPPAHGPWLEEVDFNCFWSDRGEFVARVRDRSEAEGRGERLRRKLSLDEWRELGFDRHSVFADPLFIDPEHGDYRVMPESPALGLGFVNFEMDRFGLTGAFPSGLLARAKGSQDR